MLPARPGSKACGKIPRWHTDSAAKDLGWGTSSPVGPLLIARVSQPPANEARHHKLVLRCGRRPARALQPLRGFPAAARVKYLVMGGRHRARGLRDRGSFARPVNAGATTTRAATRRRAALASCVQNSVRTMLNGCGAVGGSAPLRAAVPVAPPAMHRAIKHDGRARVAEGPRYTPLQRAPKQILYSLVRHFHAWGQHRRAMPYERVQQGRRVAALHAPGHFSPAAGGETAVPSCSHRVGIRIAPLMFATTKSERWSLGVAGLSQVRDLREPRSTTQVSACGNDLVRHATKGITQSCTDTIA